MFQTDGIWGAILKQCIGITTLDDSKYICLRPDVDELKTNKEAFEHLLKLAPPEITKSMRYQLEKREERNKIWCGLTYAKQLTIHKVTLQIIDEVVKTFTLRTDIDSLEEIVKMIFEFKISPLKEMQQKVEECQSPLPKGRGLFRQV